MMCVEKYIGLKYYRNSLGLIHKKPTTSQITAVRKKMLSQKEAYL